MEELQPDRNQIEIFADALFRHAGDKGFVSLRAFYEDDSAKAFRISPVSLDSGLRPIVERAKDDAYRAANHPKSIVFCPPIAVFNTGDKARERDIAAGLALSVELDQQPHEARRRLEEIVGPATVVVRSGGRWCDPESGEVEDKLHLHWRLANPARGPEPLAKLKQARDLAARLVGGDLSNKPVCHPIRWPGSWHRKSGPRLCEIVERNPDQEINLSATLEALYAAFPTAGDGAGDKTDGEAAHAGTPGDWDQMIIGIISGESFHAALAALAMKLLVAGMSDGAAVNMMRALMGASTAPRDVRWHVRFNDIPRAVSSAREKVDEGAGSGPGGAAPQLHWHGDPNVPVERDWLIENLLPEIGTGLLAGMWGTYKTFVVLNLSAAIMTGSEFIDYPVARRGGVLFIAAEGESEIPIRLQAVVEARCPGMMRAPFAWTGSCPSLLEPKAVDILAGLAREAHARMMSQFGLPLALIVIDTMSSATAFAKSGDENDAAVISTIMRNLAQLAWRTATMVLAVDHFGKDQTVGVRGSSVKEGNIDAVLALLADRAVSGQVTNTRLAARKVRGGPSAREVPFSVRVIDMGVDHNGRPMTTLVVDWSVQPDKHEKSDKPDRWAKSLRLLRQALMNILVDHGTDIRPWSDGPMVRAVNVDLVRAEFYRTYLADGDAAAKQTARQKAFRRAVLDAQTRGLIGLYDIGPETVMWLVRPEDGSAQNA